MGGVNNLDWRAWIAIGALLVAAVAAFAGCGSGDDARVAAQLTETSAAPAAEDTPASSVSAIPTSSIGKAASDVQAALNQARDILEVGPPYARLSEIGPVLYVETTYEQVVSLGGINLPPVDTRENPPVWVVVAYGRFQDRSVPGSTTPGQSYTTRAIVMAQEQPGLMTTASNEQYDLTQLGTVHEVPLPLPPFPTPVALDGQ